MGDCELLVGAYPDYKIHVHSNTPNLVLEHMLQLGQIYEVFIHNMEMEAHDRTAKIHEDQERPPSPPRRWALSPLPPVPARLTSSSPLASTWSSPVARL